MGPRLVRLIAATAIAIAGLRLGRLLEPSVDAVPWQAVVGIAAVLGVLLTWALRALAVSAGTAVVVHAVALVLVAVRVIAPGDLLLGFLPGPDAVPTIAAELGVAGELIRFGAAPVLPVPGLIAIIAAIFWALGTILASSRPAVAGVLALVLYLQFATLDRRPPGDGWTVAFLVVGAAVLAALVSDRGARVGRARRSSGDPIPRRSIGVVVASTTIAVVAAVFATSSLAAAVPESGALRWRTQSGIGSGLYGSGSFNLFVGLQQSLVELGDDPMFYARLSSSAPPNDELYWKLITLDVFDGENWVPSEQTFAPGGAARWEREDWSYRGDTARVASTVRIAGLTGQFLPTLYSPVDLRSDEPLIAESFRVREDGSIAVDLQALDGWEYQIDAVLPQPDLARLATDDGELSPIFANAVRAGVTDLSPADVADPDRPESLDSYTDLPEGVDERVAELSRQATAGGSTDFERAVLLETFLRDPELFTYSTEVDTGHSALDLAEWLVEPESRNFRTGYCEQFATAMAAMGRTLGIPSRVVLGFTPGDTETQDDGSEIVVVRERNAHAWVEMWMPGEGWVRFDPTPRSDGVNPSLAGEEIGFDLREHLPDPSQLEAAGGTAVIPREDLLDPGFLVPEGEDAAGLSGGEGGGGLPGWWWILPALVAPVLAVPVVKAARRRRRLAAIRDGDVSAAWREIVDRLADLGSAADPADTPLEIARREDSALEPLALLYSAAAYGGRRRADCEVAFERAEQALRRRYPGSRWTRSSWSPESLVADRGGGRKPNGRRGLRSPGRSASRR